MGALTEEYSRSVGQGVVYSVGPAPELLLPLQILEAGPEDNVQHLVFLLCFFQVLLCN